MWGHGCKDLSLFSGGLGGVNITKVKGDTFSMRGGGGFSFVGSDSIGFESSADGYNDGLISIRIMQRKGTNII
jgi:hypothetical protein